MCDETFIQNSFTSHIVHGIFPAMYTHCHESPDTISSDAYEMCVWLTVGTDMVVPSGYS